METLNAMKLLPILLIIVSMSGYAEEECIFDETAYTGFIHKYNAENKDSTIESNGKTLIVNRNNEEVFVKGGGCTHFGVTIELRTKQTYAEKKFLQKILNFSSMKFNNKSVIG